jgi:hypothetical protein
VSSIDVLFFVGEDLNIFHIFRVTKNCVTIVLKLIHLIFLKNFRSLY